ncbi:MAG: hypothetical protein Q8R22_06465 [Flavobacterium sp.]|uniref:hypothetical protein n=1 Tax=Flavobacterium sp. TaxID=239 RepID=UPI0027322EFE|nr:hypothetical protein [Flavobacterium sp.]MDP3680460.1 hypothetical protein [Flavobacterium sp.]
MKKNTPLQVLQTLEPYLTNNSPLCELTQPGDLLMKFKDKDNDSDFYFNILQYKTDTEFLLLIDWKPMNSNTVSNKQMWIKANLLETYFKNWIDLLRAYENVKTIYDDPIIEAFADEYYTEFEIIDDDANEKPFKTKQILLLNDHLEDIQNRIGEFINEENKTEIQEIISDVIELKANLSKKSKKWVIKNLSLVWAKITKQGPVFMKEFLSETSKFVIKEGVKFIYEKGTELLS